jgi:hypothetical protein
MTEFDDIAIAILPIVEGGEIVTDGLETSQAILTYALAFWHPIASDTPLGRAAKRWASTHQSPSPGFGEKNWNLSGFPSQSLESGGGGFFIVMFRQTFTNSAFSRNHFSSPGSVSGLIASTGHFGCFHRDCLAAPRSVP